MAPEPSLPTYTGLLIRRAQQIHVALWNRIVCTEVSSVQYGVLSLLARSPGASQRDIGVALDLDRSTIADLVQRLERRGMLTRRRVAGDKRRNALVLTEFGHTENQRLTPRVAELEAALTAPLTSERRDDLRSLLTLVVEAHR